MNYKPIDKCVACGSGNLRGFLDLGEQPLANNFQLTKRETESYPLGLNVCGDCSHVQQKIAVDPALMFGNYPYVSGTSKSLQAYFQSFADMVEKDFDKVFQGKKRPLKILEIGSNDGSLLRVFKSRGHDVRGIDPAENIASEASKRGIPTIVGYWNTGNAARLTGPFDVIIAMNVLAHVDDPLAFLKLAKISMNPFGRMYVQTSQARMIERGEFDTVYHEHISFFCARSFVKLMARAGHCIEDIRHVDVHGTSYLVKLTNQMPSATATELAYSIGKYEAEHGWHKAQTYDGFQEKVEQRCEDVRQKIAEARKSGLTVIGYGAAAKGMTFLNHAKIDLEFIVDDNTLKQQRLTPGRQIPVKSPHALDKLEGDALVLIPAWNMAPEIIESVKQHRPKANDKFLTYFPEVKVS